MNAHDTPTVVRRAQSRLAFFRMLLVAIPLIAASSASPASTEDSWTNVFHETLVLPTDWITRQNDPGVAIDEACDATIFRDRSEKPPKNRQRPRWLGEFEWIAPTSTVSQFERASRRVALFEDAETIPPLEEDLTLVGLPSPMSLLTAPLGMLSVIRGGRIRGEYLDDFDENSRAGGSLILDSVWFVGVDTEAYYWTEDDPAGGDRNLANGDVNVIWQYGAGTPMRFQTGLGMNWLHMGGETDYGFNTTYGLEIQVKSWLAFGGSLDWGRVGDEELFHGRITASYMIGLLEIYAGYDIYEVGWIEREGLIAGVGLWF